MSHIYEPGEDSYLLQSAVKKYAQGNVLEIGTGSGLLAIEASKKAKTVMAVDINRKAIGLCKKKHKQKNIIFKVSDLFSNVNGIYDTIIFNPPYLPLDKREPKKSRLATTGGKHGYELLVKFIKQSPKFLSRNGRILIIFSSLTNKNKVDEAILETMYDKDVIETKKIDYEELYVYLIKKSGIRNRLEKKVKEITFFTKGKHGLIFTCQGNGRRIAIKMKNPDSLADEAVINEGKMLRFANRLGIGPRIITTTNSYVAYVFVEGETLHKKIDSLKKNKIKKIIEDLIKQLVILDINGITKEEMNNPYKHIIITKKDKPVLIDFERAHKTKKTHNLTQFCSYLLRLRKILLSKKIQFSNKEVIKWAKEYAHTSNDGKAKSADKLVSILFD